MTGVLGSSLASDHRPTDNAWEGFVASLRAAHEQKSQEKVESKRIEFRPYAERIPEGRSPLDLNLFAFQRELYSQPVSEAAEIVVMKSSQVGMSTWAIRQVLYWADVLQYKPIYCFPTKDELNEFSRDRIGPLIGRNPHLLERMGFNTTEQKQFGNNGILYFRGLQKPLDAIDADGIVFDEYDACNRDNIEKSEHRVSGPLSAGLTRRLGYPLVGAGGIAAMYEASDQRVWMVKCSACSKHQPIKGIDAFTSNVDKENVRLVCRYCRRPLDVTTGEWVATYPDRDVRGYSISKMLVPIKKTLAGLIADSLKTRPDQVETFHQRGLGEHYATPDSRLTREQLEACTRSDLRFAEGYSGLQPVIMGVDVADKRGLNVTIEEMTSEVEGRKLWIGVVEDDPIKGSTFQQMCALMIRFKVTMAAFDHAPAYRWLQQIMARFPGRVYSVASIEPSKTARKLPPDWDIDDRLRHVTLWRTKGYEAMLERWRMQRVIIPPLDHIDPDFPTHLGNIQRKVEENEDDGTKTVRFLRLGPEDYAQAELYCNVARALVLVRAGLATVRAAAPAPVSSRMIDDAENVRGLDALLPSEQRYSSGLD